MSFYKYELKIKYFFIFILPFFFKEIDYESIKPFFLIYIFINIHLIFINYFYNLDFNFIKFTKILFFFLLSIFILKKHNLFFNHLEKIVFFVSSIFLIRYIYFIYFNNLDSNFILSCYNGFISQNNFFFSENSHFGFTFVGIFFFYFYKLFQNKESILKKFFIILFLVLIFVNYSTSFLFTLLVLSPLFWFLEKRNNSRSLLIFLIISFISLFTLLKDQQCNIRLFSSLHILKVSINKYIPIDNFLSESLIEKRNNLSVSSVVHSNSLSILKSSVINKPFGIGFDNYAIAHAQNINNTKISFNKLYWYYLENFNITDASNNFVKLTSELGIFSIFIYLLIIKFTLSKKIPYEFKLLFLPPVFCQIFFRGAGYFNGGFLVYLLFMFILLKNKNSKNA